jgi:serine/threonine protein kinase
LSGDPKIIHRNIKAANILVDYNYDAKVINYIASVLGAIVVLKITQKDIIMLSCSFHVVG